MDARAKARRFLVYRAWKAADDMLVSTKDIARVTGLPESTASNMLIAMGLSHASRTDANRERPSAYANRQAVDRFMAAPDRRETRFAYFGD